MKELYEALIKAQGQIKIALKDSNNPHFRSKYADLASVWDAVRDALQANKLGVVQLTRIHESGTPVLVTRIIHASGQHIEGEYPIVCKDPSDPQKILSSVTYSRRASLAAALGVIADDDDGNTAAGHAPAAKPAVSAVQQNVAKVASPVNELLSAHGKTMADIEALVGAKQSAFTDSHKAKASAILQALKAGKPWSEAIK